LKNCIRVKCAVADEKLLFLSSANLTEYAFTVNMELGILIQCVNLPSDVVKHFDKLILVRVLIPLD
jgi:phosphatidylserine/phosphatidylglycerophosphate/cardiolipin synthase-like enzyme